MLERKILYRDPQEKEIGAVIELNDEGKNTNCAKGTLNGRTVELLDKESIKPSIEKASRHLKGTGI